MKCNRKKKMAYGGKLKMEKGGKMKSYKKGGKMKKYKKGGKLKDACWEGYEAVGMKMKDGKKVPNCVPKRKK